jgi:S-formylglutathione hydrolase FrmB
VGLAYIRFATETPAYFEILNRPELYDAEDPLIEANRRLHDDLTAHGVTHRYQEFPGYHSWDYWALHLPDSLLFFEECLRRAPAAATRP